MLGRNRKGGEEGGESVLISPLDTYISFVSFTVKAIFVILKFIFKKGSSLGNIISHFKYSKFRYLI